MVFLKLDRRTFFTHSLLFWEGDTKASTFLIMLPKKVEAFVSPSQKSRENPKISLAALQVSGCAESLNKLPYCHIEKKTLWPPGISTVRTTEH